MYSVIRFCVFAENVLIIGMRQEFWNTIDHRVHRAVLTSYLERRREGDVSPNTRHETSDLFDHASRDRPRSVHKNSSVEFKSRGQVSRRAVLSKLAELVQFFVTRAVILLEKHGITTILREYSAMRDDPAAEAKGVLGDNTIFWPIYDAKIALHKALRCRSIP